MLNEFYYGNRWIDTKRKTSNASLILVVPFYFLPAVFGMQTVCHFTLDSLELTRLTKPNQRKNIPYTEIGSIELFVIRRKWEGGTFLSMLVPYYNFDLVVHLKDNGRDDPKLEIEFPATYSFVEAIQRLKENHIYVHDAFGVFERFTNEESFKKDFASYFDEHYHALAAEYGLDDPRIGFTARQRL